jgi:hypothetical protein
VSDLRAELIGLPALVTCDRPDSTVALTSSLVITSLVPGVFSSIFTKRLLKDVSHL